MGYSKEFILEAIALYRSGQWPETPEGVKDTEDFHGTVRRWSRREEVGGLDSFDKKQIFRTPEEKYELVSRVIAGESLQSVAIKNGVSSGSLHKWVQVYKTQGYNGLEKMRGKSQKNPVTKKKGRTPKIPVMKKNTDTRPLTESEREELIRLRAEIEYIKTENEVIKKRIALRHEKWAAQLKAKKQQSSKNSEKRDTN